MIQRDANTVKKMSRRGGKGTNASFRLFYEFHASKMLASKYGHGRMERFNYEETGLDTETYQWGWGSPSFSPKTQKLPRIHIMSLTKPRV
ncbi:hypothetical protein CEXT_448491 [Caerostris extrusa]|uniref:Uncharacterized protein n=1 Tax=Caerostris extrusa TaxID=172846 RepID=A0AAV4R5B3_CAEEX|nr:hypothetical protein CEXT_448491 [Caerostris extrusa]